MTREEWLTYLDTTWKKCLSDAWQKEWDDMKDDDTMCYRSELEAAVKAAVEAEREACAKVCEQEVCACCWEDDAQAAAEHLAERIRARGQA
jgi:hypothetical protein